MQYVHHCVGRSHRYSVHANKEERLDHYNLKALLNTTLGSMILY